MQQIWHNAEQTIQIDYTKRSGYFTMTTQHTHEGYELYYLFAGERDYFIRDRTYRVERGGFVFIDKGELHRTVDTGVPDHERVVFNFEEALLEEFPFIGRNGVLKLPPQEEWRGEALARELVAEAKGNAPGRDLMLASMLKQLLLLVFRAQEGQAEEAEQPSPLHRTMSEVAAYVGAHVREPLTLGDVAERFFLSPYYLSRKFKSCTGFGFAEYVQLVRVREAQRLLRETDLKIPDVAERTGVESTAGFHKLFKKLAGCSPLQYRKRQRALPGETDG
ncbi:AraC family transcriptional regulator [Paenibacillus sp. TRM 82003]|nr:AraC family transcriptional regulator [Paenibacillus sp. TRM 82003]